MLLVETYIAISERKGIGLFTKSFIPKGTVYWIRDEKFDRVFTKGQMLELRSLAIAYIQYHGFLEKSGNWYLCNDNARFSNHSSNPNTINHFDNDGLIKHSSMSQDINEGEEITCDYTEICMTCANGIDFIAF